MAQLFLGAFFGILIVMALYNLLLFLTIRDTSFLFYGLFIGSYVLYQIAVERIGFEYLWPEHVWWNERSHTTLGLVCAAAGIQFTRVVLETNRLLPRLDRVLLGLMAACPLFILLNLFVRHPIVNVGTVLFALAVVGLLLSAALLSLWYRNVAARYYLLAWALMLGGIFIHLLTLLGSVSYTFWATRSAQIGAVFGVTLLSLGLGYRYTNLRRAREQLRLRIASDLHDDIGSGLTQIALYSELIRRDTDGQLATWAAHTGELARSLTSNMQDIVWAIQPTQKDWEDLELRMKDYAADLLAPQGIDFAMKGEQADGRMELPPNVRQNVLLMFKEIVHNAVRHADCSRITVDWHLDRRRLQLQLADNGRGFDPAVVRSGNGLQNLRRRAAEIGADLQFHTAPGRATRITITVPL